jgi:hypothetical protein
LTAGQSGQWSHEEEAVEHYPRIDEFLIGYSPDREQDDPTRIGIIRQPGSDNRRGRVGPLFGMVENMGDAALTFEVHQSSDNAVGDAYAAISIRVNGAAVSSVVVAPGGKVAFSVEVQTENYLKFKATAGSQGRLVLCSFGGHGDRREREKIV